MTLLPPMAADLRHCHALNANLAKGILDRLKSRRLNYGFDFYHQRATPAPTSGFQIVAFLTMLRDVQPFDLMVLAHPHADQQIGDLQKNNCADQRHDPGSQNPNQLIAYLRPVSIDRAYGFAGAKDGVDRLRGKDPGEQRAHCSARAMDAESIERVIIAE